RSQRLSHLLSPEQLFLSPLLHALLFASWIRRMNLAMHRMLRWKRKRKERVRQSIVYESSSTPKHVDYETTNSPYGNLIAHCAATLWQSAQPSRAPTSLNIWE